MNNITLAALGVASAALQLISMVPYLIDIICGKTKPERATWWIWSLLNVVSLTAQIAAHAKWSVLMTAAQASVTIIVAVLTLKYGYGTFHKKDASAIVFALIGVFLWWLLDSPLAALIVVLIVDLAGLWLTIEKTWKAPHTETLAMWILGAASGLLGAVAAGHWNATHILYPLYIGLGNALMVFIILTRRSVVDAKGKPRSKKP